MKLLKFLYLSIFVSFLLASTANASSFTLTPTDDIALTRTFGRYAAIDAVNHGLQLQNDYIIYLKFDISDVPFDKQSFSSAKLRLQTGYNSPKNVKNDINLYSVKDNNWNDGQLYYINIMPDKSSIKEAFNSTNKPVLNDTALATGAYVSNADSMNNWYEWEFDSKNLDISKNGDYVSLALKMDSIKDPYAFITFFESEGDLNYDKLLAHVYDDGTYWNSYEVSAKSISLHSPQLVINTEPKPVPNPEPSSMILGLVSLSGLLSIKRKNK